MGAKPDPNFTFEKLGIKGQKALNGAKLRQIMGPSHLSLPGDLFYRYPLANFEALVTQISLLWNDAPANRMVKFIVQYSIEVDTLHIFDVQPTEVALLDMQWQTVVTRMQVKSSKTYQLLRARFLESNSLKELVDEIADRNGLSIVAT